MAANILIKSKAGEYYIVKKSDIRRVASETNKETVIRFNGVKNTPIIVEESVEDFFNTYLG